MTILFFADGCSPSHKQQSKEWLLPGYDRGHTFFYPFPSKMKAAKIAFTQLWSVGDFWEPNYENMDRDRLAGIFVKDINQDGKLDIMGFSPSSRFFYTTQGEPVTESTVADLCPIINQRTKPDLALIASDHSIILEGKSIGKAPQISYLFGGMMVDLYDNGVGEMLSCEFTPWDQKNPEPHYITLYEPNSLKQLWRFFLGPIPYVDVVLDINKDGNLEILGGTYASQHGFSANGMIDWDQGYVFALDRRGNLLWRTSFNYERLRTKSAVKDLDRDGNFEIVTSVGSWFNDWGCIAVLRARDGTILHKYRSEYSFTGVALADMNGDGKSEIVTASKEGAFYIFDNNLQLIAESKLDYHGRKGPTRREKISPAGSYDYNVINTYVEAVNDINGDGKPEVIGSISYEKYIATSIYNYPSNFYNSKLLIFDSHLNLLQEIPTKEPVRAAIVCDLIPGGSNEIIALTNSLECYSQK